jgi:glyoxylase I family protein
MMTIDHVTIRTGALPSVRAFFLEVFELEEGPRPLAIQRIPGHWLYSGGKPVVHLIGSGEPAGGIARDRPGETIDHVGFRLANYWGLRDRLDARGIRYSLMDLPDINERRIFLWTPGGTLLEAVFDADATTSEPRE